MPDTIEYIQGYASHVLSPSNIVSGEGYVGVLLDWWYEDTNDTGTFTVDLYDSNKGKFRIYLNDYHNKPFFKNPKVTSESNVDGLTLPTMASTIDTDAASDMVASDNGTLNGSPLFVKGYDASRDLYYFELDLTPLKHRKPETDEVATILFSGIRAIGVARTFSNIRVLFAAQDSDVYHYYGQQCGYLELSAARVAKKTAQTITSNVDPAINYGADGKGWVDWQPSSSGTGMTGNTRVVTATGNKVTLNKNGNITWEIDPSETPYYQVFTVRIDIHDDLPYANDVVNTIEESTTVVSGNVLDTQSYGADGKAEENAFVWNVENLNAKQTDDGYDVTTLNGKISLYNDGRYTYNIERSDYEVFDMPEPQQSEEGFVTIPALRPRADGLIFVGWSTTKERADNLIVDYAPGSTVYIAADRKLYASWA